LKHTTVYLYTYICMYDHGMHAHGEKNEKMKTNIQMRRLGTTNKLIHRQAKVLFYAQKRVQTCMHAVTWCEVLPPQFAEILRTCTR
jgi:hypothetical protein